MSDTASESASAAGGSALTGDERAELQRLRTAAAKKLLGLIELIGRPPAAPAPEPSGHG